MSDVSLSHTVVAKSAASLAAAPAPGVGVGVERPNLDGRSVGGLKLRRAASVAVVGLLLFVLAAGVRLYAIDAYVTIDESRWVQRASDFWALIGQGNREDTFIIGHPGVTTMHTALLGMGPERARAFSFLEGRADATRRDGYFDALVASRRPFALVGALGVAATALLGWRLFGAGPGILGGLLLAFEPFLIAHARVTHLDSGLTTYATIAALSGIIYFTSPGAARGTWPYLLLSGAATGLAFLTKAPSVYVILFVPLVAGLCWLTLSRRPLGMMRAAVELAIWGAVAASVGFLLWPALQVNPVGTVLKMAQFTERVGGGEHDNFFAGVVTDDPGPVFYPLALLLRLAPATLLGAILVAACWRQLSRPRRGIVGLLVLYCVGFMAMMTIGPKKFDRYVLPTMPMVGLLAGLGLWLAAGWLAERPALRAFPFTARRLVLPSVALLLQVAVLLPVIRYPLAYYNPLLGGSAVADRLVLVGWGEGLDQVGAWIGQQPRPLGEPIVATSYHRVLQAQLSGSAVPLEHVRMADYVVPYVNTLQRGMDADVLAPFLRDGSPLHSVRINGIEYARVYQGPHYPTGADLDADFGGRARLLRYDAAPGTGVMRATEELTVLLRWDRPATAGERVVVGVVAADGRLLVQDERPLGADGPNAEGQPGELHRLTLPRQTAPGTYRLTLRVQDGRTRAAVPVTGGPQSGQESVLLREIVVERTP
ncbi:MAG: glycosyltransferase family 39 protein [Chloroflexi bacterium]|nr:glycosyltransferase family 39 protein [Chloroflexota bacterium]